jgi:hypothetical protein
MNSDNDPSPRPYLKVDDSVKEQAQQSTSNKPAMKKLIPPALNNIHAFPKLSPTNGEAAAAEREEVQSSSRPVVPAAPAPYVIPKEKLNALIRDRINESSSRTVGTGVKIVGKKSKQRSKGRSRHLIEMALSDSKLEADKQAAMDEIELAIAMSQSEYVHTNGGGDSGGGGGEMEEYCDVDEDDDDYDEDFLLAMALSQSNEYGGNSSHSNQHFDNDDEEDEDEELKLAMALSRSQLGDSCSSGDGAATEDPLTSESRLESSPCTDSTVGNSSDSGELEISSSSSSDCIAVVEGSSVDSLSGFTMPDNSQGVQDAFWDMVDRNVSWN